MPLLPCGHSLEQPQRRGDGNHGAPVPLCSPPDPSASLHRWAQTEQHVEAMSLPLGARPHPAGGPPAHVPIRELAVGLKLLRAVLVRHVALLHVRTNAGWELLALGTRHAWGLPCTKWRASAHGSRTEGRASPKLHLDLRPRGRHSPPHPCLLRRPRVCMQRSRAKWPLGLAPGGAGRCSPSPGSCP